MYSMLLIAYSLCKLSTPATVISTCVVLKSIGNLRLNIVWLPVPVKFSVCDNVVIKNVPVVLSNLETWWILLTLLFPIWAVILAGLELVVDCVPSIVIVGADKYPEPGFVIVIYFIDPPVPNVAVALAPVPPPPLNLICGTSKYP